MKNLKASPLAHQFGPTLGFFGSCRREYFDTEVLLLFLSLRYGADLGRSRLVLCISRSTLNSQLLRASICSVTAADEVSAEDLFPHTNGFDYLKATSMETRGTYASVEIKATCDLLDVHIIVYTDLTHNWLLFSIVFPSTAASNIFFLHQMPSSHLSVDHFQPVLNVAVDIVPSPNTLLYDEDNSVDLPFVFAANETFCRSFVKKESSSRKQCSESDTDSCFAASSNSSASRHKSPVNSNHIPNPSVDDATCRKCYRVSTMEYPIELQPRPNVNFRKFFGMTNEVGDSICKQCLLLDCRY